jgi:hypothetical protein
MRSVKILDKFESLPIDDQKEVLDFINFLKTKKRTKRRKRISASSFQFEKFIGLWKDRDDLKDSTSWVRNLRRREWANFNEK